MQIKNNIRGKESESIYFILATVKGKIASTFAKNGLKVGQRKHGFKKIVELLIENGANVSLTNNDGRTALHEAAHWGNYLKPPSFSDTENYENELFYFEFQGTKGSSNC